MILLAQGGAGNVFSHHDSDDWHFINAKRDDKTTQRLLLRRMVVNQREQLRTAIKQISELDLQFIGRQQKSI
jgi:hypothetical protein